jgi:hypothetical protein
MPDGERGELKPEQVAALKRLLEAGFRLVTLERYEQYLGVEKEGFVALLELSGDRLRVYSQVGYSVGEGIGMLVEGARGKAFVCHSESVPATPELLTMYNRTKAELQELLHQGLSQ